MEKLRNRELWLRKIKGFFLIRKSEIYFHAQCTMNVIVRKHLRIPSKS